MTASLDNQALDNQALSRSIGDLTSSLGDPTRRGIYIAIRQSAEGMTASSVAAVFGIHSNVARHHLDRLADDGFLEVTTRRAAGKSGPGAGRPAKCYTATNKVICNGEVIGVDGGEYITGS